MTTASVAVTTLDIRGVSLVSREAGDGETLLYLHDELSTGWNAYLDLLAQRFHVIAPELPGFGDTERPDWIEDVADAAFFVADVVTQVGGGAPINIVGGSLGGWLAIEAALRGAPIARIVAGCSSGARRVWGLSWPRWSRATSSGFSASKPPTVGPLEFRTTSRPARIPS